jgi:hypothetical protein
MDRISPFRGRATAAPEGKPLDPAQVERALRLLADPGGECELRSVRPTRSAVALGGDIRGLLAAARSMEGAQHVYVCLNPVSLGAPCDRAASDEHVTRRRWLFVDVDPDKADEGKDACATQAEKDAARAAAAAVESHLGARGWPEPVEVDSGNGHYLLYRIELPNDEPSRELCRRALHALAALCPAGAKIDRAVHNASRIARLPGTWNRKGRDRPERPHRMCRLARVPQEVGVVTREQLEALAGGPAKTHEGNGSAKHSPFRGRASGGRLEAYCRRLLSDEVLSVAMAAKGERNNALNEAAFAVGTVLAWGVVAEAEVAETLAEAARRAGLGEAEIGPTIASGLRAGKALPRDLPEWARGAGTGTPAEAREKPLAGQFPRPIPAPELRLADPALCWVLNGLLRRGEITLLPALWKSGKTTLLAHLLRAMAQGGEFLGRELLPSKALYVTEESESRWALRRDQVGIGAQAEFLVRPFAGKPSVVAWEQFLAYVGSLVAELSYDVVVFDTLANLWPLKDENDAASVQACLMPMHAMIGEKAALLAVHHTRKSDGSEATASRGSGALAAFVDTILEFRRYTPGDRRDCRRVISGYGRHDETPDELVVELTPDGYVALPGRDEIARGELGDVIAGILPPSEPGLNADQVREEWPEGSPPRRDRIVAALNAGAESGRWRRSGTGKRGSPHLFWKPLAVV